MLNYQRVFVYAPVRVKMARVSDDQCRVAQRKEETTCSLGVLQSRGPDYILTID